VEIVLKEVKEKLLKLLSSDAFRGVAASAASAGVLVVGANVGLAALGFTATGIQAGSIAAAWMATYGGTVASGSLLAGLQSVGAVGIGVVATGGIALIGALIPAVIFGGIKIHKYVHSIPRTILVYIERQGKIDNTPEHVTYFLATTLKQLLVRYLTADVLIPSEIKEIAIWQYDAQNRKKIVLTNNLDRQVSDLKLVALVISKRDPTMTNDQLRFYLKKNRDLWDIHTNTVQRNW